MPTDYTDFTILALLCLTVSSAWADTSKWVGGTYTATVNEVINATINVTANATLTINGSIVIAGNATLTVTGPGTLVVNGSHGIDGDDRGPLCAILSILTSKISISSFFSVR